MLAVKAWTEPVILTLKGLRAGATSAESFRVCNISMWDFLVPSHHKRLLPQAVIQLARPRLEVAAANGPKMLLAAAAKA